MPAAFKLRLRPRAEGKLPANQGPAVHGLFLEMIRRGDAGLAAALHEGSGQQPFTLSPPFKAGGQPGDAALEAKENAELDIRLCILDDGLVPAVYNALLISLRQTDVRLCGLDFTLAGLLAEGSGSYEEIAAEALEAPPLHRFRLNFKTPTCFKHEGRSALFPEPDFILGGLARRWNLYAERVDYGLVRQIVEGVYPAQYELKTEVLEMTGRAQYFKTGFTGYCIYEADGLHEEAERTLCRLLLFLNYAGVGYKTTMGMGQAQFRALP